jgi:hemerythrin superfamily protein
MFAMNKLSPSITDLVRFDHSQVLDTFHQYTSSTRPSVKKALADTVCDALEIHATLEEEVFYPVLRRLSPDEPVISKSEPEHDEMRRMIGQLRAAKASDERHDSLMYELMRDVLHHVADEETVLLPEAERLLGKNRLAELGAAMTRRRLELRKPKTGVPANTAAMVVGLAGALLAARYVVKKAPALSEQH